MSTPASTAKTATPATATMIRPRDRGGRAASTASRCSSMARSTSAVRAV